MDPLSEITDSKNDRFVAESIGPILHVDGLGPSRYDVRLDAGTRSVRAYIVCAPDSPFTVAIGKRFWADCTTRFQAFADIPVEAGRREVAVTVPDATRFILLVIPTPTQPR
ncbi:hypothetical protein SAMN05421684_6477 [Asanoa ishikariensis]|uniref:Uncharacterized protein n=1 Tax=Asanoa ishikariensis TaxID=137265 RepID=A0A1H3TVT7_9ACTN|nr:hypothetical protein SAMN05421684_6477 [Asanoa ishikariensis]